jgi:hypothetical protein
MSDRQLLSFSDAAARISASGVKVRPRTVGNWGYQYPGLTVKIAGRCAIPSAAIPLIIAGLPLADIANRMRNSRAESRSSDSGGDPGRQ